MGTIKNPASPLKSTQPGRHRLVAMSSAGDPRIHSGGFFH